MKLRKLQNYFWASWAGAILGAMVEGILEPRDDLGDMRDSTLWDRLDWIDMVRKAGGWASGKLNDLERETRMEIKERGLTEPPATTVGNLLSQVKVRDHYH